MTLGQLWRKGAVKLKSAAVENAAREAKLLLCHISGKSDLELVTQESQTVSPALASAFEEAIDRRINGEPVARIIGAWEFYGLEFTLNADTLVPRKETEGLVDLALAALEGTSDTHILDLGTGSGAIPIAILANNTNARATALDISDHALEAARLNAKRHQVADRVNFLRSSWFTEVRSTERFDLIISNPPYIASSTVQTLNREVKDHDPIAALDGGEDGLDAYRTIVSHAPNFLKDEGQLLLEIGFDQANSVSNLCTQAGLTNIEVAADLAGHPRIVSAHKS